MIQTSATRRERHTVGIRNAVWIAIWAFFALGLVAACAPQTEQSTTWSRQELPGKRLVLMDERMIEEFSFNADGSVNATFGEKDGARAGPILDWRIENEVLIISKGPKRESVEELRLVSINGNVLTVRMTSGPVVKFKLGKDW